jgi:pyridinium-3,5-biscarboxylic acid mononucleotide synthase
MNYAAASDGVLNPKQTEFHRKLKMNADELKQLLERVKDGDININSAIEKLKDLPFTDLGHSRIDNHRELRQGYPEVIYGAGKTVDQLKEIVSLMLERGNNILITRVTDDMYPAIKNICNDAIYHKTARIIQIKRKELSIPDSYISIVTAGTSDIPVAEEAAITAEALGNRVEKIFDVGVAGIHRIMDKLELIRNSKVIIVIAGMEGALSSVIGGLVDKPVIAVPTSVGYGANFGGISALLGMLTSCASGVSVVNIDNGFGAAYTASMINKLK